MFQPEKFSDYLSILALLVSTISLFISYMNYRRQGGLLKTRLDFEPKSPSGDFILKLENQGFHGIKISQIRLIVGSRVLPVDEEGFELEYGKERLVRISLAGYKDFHPLQVSRLEVLDVGDSVHKVSTRGLRRKMRQ